MESPKTVDFQIISSQSCNFPFFYWNSHMWELNYPWTCQPHWPGKQVGNLHTLSLSSLLQNQSSSLILHSEAYHLLKPPLPLFHFQQINYADLLLSLQHHLIPFPEPPNSYLNIIKSIYNEPIVTVNSIKDKNRSISTKIWNKTWLSPLYIPSQSSTLSLNYSN